MNSAPSLADIVFGYNGAISKRELKKLYHVSSSREVKRELKAAAPKLKIPGVWTQISSSFPSLFHISAADILFYGWEKFSQIGKALFPADPNADDYINVPLHNYTFVSKHKPRIDLFYQGQKIVTLEFDLAINFNFSSMILVFQRGELVELLPGNCEGTAELKYGRRVIISRKILEFKWPGKLKVDQQKREPYEPLAHDVSTQVGKSSPQLPPMKRKRGCGCLFTLMFLGCMIATGIYMSMYNQVFFVQMRNELLRLLQNLF